ncbi:hypothetical protein Taro_021820 [Colocasia esculenta]|uniref:Uncharacterized protein n=1 Tax=Colocasia esculenta TaxID=4460 RepID=A0A843V6J2_COLES|nr:hypothetical protein [Colocasia esculenta]
MIVAAALASVDLPQLLLKTVLTLATVALSVATLVLLAAEHVLLVPCAATATLVQCAQEMGQELALAEMRSRNLPFFRGDEGTAVALKTVPEKMNSARGKRRKTTGESEREFEMGIEGDERFKERVLWDVSGEDSDEEEEYISDKCEDDDEDGAELNISSSSEEEMDII